MERKLSDNKHFYFGKRLTTLTIFYCPSPLVLFLANKFHFNPCLLFMKATEHSNYPSSSCQSQLCNHKGEVDFGLIFPFINEFILMNFFSNFS